MGVFEEDELETAVIPMTVTMAQARTLKFLLEGVAGSLSYAVSESPTLSRFGGRGVIEAIDAERGTVQSWVNTLQRGMDATTTAFRAEREKKRVYTLLAQTDVKSWKEVYAALRDARLGDTERFIRTIAKFPDSHKPGQPRVSFDEFLLKSCKVSMYPSIHRLWEGVFKRRLELEEEEAERERIDEEEKNNRT